MVILTDAEFVSIVTVLVIKGWTGGDSGSRSPKQTFKIFSVFYNMKIGVTHYCHLEK